MSVEISASLFWTRLKALHQDIKSGGRKWAGVRTTKSDPDEDPAPVTCLALAFGRADSDSQDFSRSIGLALSLYGYEIPRSLHVLTEDTFYIVVSRKTAKILGPLEAWDGDKGGLELRILTRNTADRNAEVLSVLHKALTGKRVGMVVKDTPRNDDVIERFLAPLEVVNVALAVSSFLAVKDEDAMRNTQLASVLTTAVLRDHLVNQIIDAINDETTVTHEQLSERTDEVLMQPNQAKELRLPSKDRFNETTCEPCYPPIVQSGGVFDLRPTAESNSEPLSHTGTIVVQVGGRYKGYCSNVGRTFFVNATEHQQAVYEMVTELYRACLAALRPGNRVGDVYLAAKRVLQQRRPDLLPKLLDNVGYGLGLQFVDTDLFLKDPEQERVKSRSQRKLEPGMVFYLCIGLDNLRADLPIQDEQERPFDRKLNYSILLGDAVRITEDDAEPLTKFGRKWDRIAYNLGDSDDEESEEEESSSEESDSATAGRDRGVSRSALRGETPGMQVNAARDRHQAEIAARKQEENLRRLAAGRVDEAFDRSRKWNEKYHSYKSVEDFPPEAYPTEIYVDSRAESILLPISDSLVPFHIGTVKNVHKRVEGPWTTLVIHFLTPQETGKERAPTWADPHAKYIREISYRSKSQSLDAIFRMIRALRKRVQDRRKEQETRASLVKQKNLIVDREKGPAARLRDVAMRPHLSRKKATGILYAHTNGFRYKSTTRQHVDIIYENIKHAFFKPAQNSISVILHFELKNGIILGDKTKKKTNFVQFYVDVIDASQDIDPRSRYRDEDGLQEEQEERRNTERWNERFKKFVKAVEEYTAQSKTEESLDFDIPYPELAFSGVPSRQRVDVMPSVNCLVALEDQPPLVIPVNEVDICSLERVDFHLREFDMVFVMKDLRSKTPYIPINSVPMKKLEEIKNWLDQSDIKFYESPKNLLWKDAIKDILADLEGFYRGGGWDSEEWFGASAGDEDEGEELTCQECEEHSARFLCKTCDKLFCTDCNQKIHAGRNMRRHRRQQIAEDSESEFEPETEDSEMDSDEYFDSDEEDEEEEDEEDFDEDGDGSEFDEDEDLSEEGLDWEEMDRKAARADREAERRDQMWTAKIRGRRPSTEESSRPQKKRRRR